jgi:hypothetical protein
MNARDQWYEVAMKADDLGERWIKARDEAQRLYALIDIEAEEAEYEASR